MHILTHLVQRYWFEYMSQQRRWWFPNDNDTLQNDQQNFFLEIYVHRYYSRQNTTTRVTF